MRDLSRLSNRAPTVRAHLDGQIADMLKMLERFVTIESGSRDKEAVDQMGRVYQEVLESLGFTTEVIEQPESGNHLIFRKTGNGGGRALILAHIDTVWPTGTLSWWPFSVRDGRATGPGVGDMKGGIVGAIFALRAVDDLGLNLPGKTTFFFVGDEELGSPTAREHIEREARAHDYVLVVEPSDIEGRIITGRGGIGAWRIDVTGKSAHTVAGPGIGASAIHSLAAKIVEFDKLTNWDRRVVVNVGLIEGGSSRQVMAEHAYAWLDLRAPTQELVDELMVEVQAIVGKEHVPGTSATLTGRWTRPPSPQTDANRQFFEQAMPLAAALGFTLTGRETGGGSDGSFTSVLGIPTLDGLGPKSGEIVSAREYVIVDSMPERSALIALLLDHVGRSPASD